MAKKQSFNLSSPLLYIVLGALFFIFGLELIGLLMTIAGIFFVVMGIVDLVRHRVVSGVVNLVIAAIIIYLGWTIGKIVLTILGIIIIAKGVLDLFSLLKHKRANALNVIFVVLTIAIGLMLAASPEGFLATAMKIAGALLIVDGVLGLIGAKK